MTSIRRRLFIILLAATGIIWVTAVAWIQHSTRTEVNHVLDRRLQESAQMVASLIERSGGIVTSDTAGFVETDPASPLPGGFGHDVSRQLVCQIWGFDGQLKSGSAGAPLQRLAEDVSGFTEREVEGIAWRVYSHVDADLGIRVMVGDALSVRDGLVGGVVLGLLAPAGLILPFLAVMIWVAVRQGMAPLEALAGLLSRRSADDLSPLAETSTLAELRPMVSALNGLFDRVNALRSRERSFIAFAAHELKTPLAGLKTQAQIAIIAPDQATRSHALMQISNGVDRTDRLARQLLDMTMVEHVAEVADAPERDGADVLQDAVRGLGALAESRNVAVVVTAKTGEWQTRDAAMLETALRNLIENAINAAPPGTQVEAQMVTDATIARFNILDRGPGISKTDRPFVTDRFYRGAGIPAGGGSGLGLAIVLAVVERMQGHLRMCPRCGGGEQAELIFPTPPARKQPDDQITRT